MSHLFELQMSAQELFEKVANHLLKQSNHSFFDDDDCCCAYRGSEGRMCAAGVLIPDDVYSERFERNRWSSLVAHHNFPETHCQLIVELQRVHDFFSVINWRDQLVAISNVFKLDTKFLTL